MRPRIQYLCSANEPWNVGRHCIGNWNVPSKTFVSLGASVNAGAIWNFCSIVLRDSDTFSLPCFRETLSWPYMSTYTPFDLTSCPVEVAVIFTATASPGKITD